MADGEGVDLRRALAQALDLTPEDLDELDRLARERRDREAEFRRRMGKQAQNAAAEATAVAHAQGWLPEDMHIEWGERG